MLHSLTRKRMEVKIFSAQPPPPFPPQSFRRKLSKWFVSRAGKEVLLRQAEVYNLGGAGSGVGVGSGTSSSSAAAEIPFSADVEDKFSEHIVYDSKAAAGEFALGDMM